MKYLNFYKKLGLRNEQEVFDYFIKTLNDTIFTWDYFVDFDKVKKRVFELEPELNLLNVLIGKKNVNKEFINLIAKYPEVRRALPLLIAVRESKIKQIKITDLKTLDKYSAQNLFNPNIKLDYQLKNKLLTFFNESGLKEVFQDKNIKNVVDYCFGVETGLDTNARKNRTGKSMEKITEKLIRQNISHKNYLTLLTQATKKKIESAFGVRIKLEKANKIFDFAVFNNQERKLTLIEVNYYSTSGSKIKSTAGEYERVFDMLKDQNVQYIWITDGWGWLSVKKSLYDAFLHNDYVFNLALLKLGVLQEILN